MSIGRLRESVAYRILPAVSECAGILAPQHQRSPGVAMDAAVQPEPPLEIGGADEPLLGPQQPRQDHHAAGLEHAVNVLGEGD